MNPGTNRMRAARFYNNSDIRIEEVPEPIVGPGEVGIKVAWCGICGTDIREFVDGPVFCPGLDVPNATSGSTAPVIIGHEISGVVDELGAGVTGFEIGDHVVVEPILLPKETLDGPMTDYNVDPDLAWIGISGAGGGLSERLAVPQRWVHKISKDIPLDQAALVEPLAVAYRAVKRSEIQPGDTALITGAGPIGLMTTLVLSAMGVKTIVSEPNALRRKTAIEHAFANHAFDPDEVDLIAEVRKVTNGHGVDVGFECSSAQSAVDEQIELIKPHGMLVMESLWGDRFTINGNKFVTKELDIRGTMCYNNDHPSAINLIEHFVFDLAPFITHRIELDDLVAVGYDTLINKHENAVKILVSPRPINA